MGKRTTNDITFEIKKIHGYLSDKKNKLLLDISWNGEPAKTELRKCWTDKDGNLRIGAGLALSDDEMEKLMLIWETQLKPVNFNKIFHSSAGITDKRAAGFRTEDGFVVLRRTDMI